MSDFVEVRHVVLIADRTLEQHLIEDCVKLGAKGWTSVHCDGRGQHAVMDDISIEPERLRVRLEILVLRRLPRPFWPASKSLLTAFAAVLGFMHTAQASSRRTF